MDFSSRGLPVTRVRRYVIAAGSGPLMAREHKKSQPDEHVTEIVGMPG
jgi:hypothetical protein